MQHEYRFSLGYFLSLFRSAVGRDVEHFKDKLEYKSDSEDTEGIKKESRTTIRIKAVDEEGAPPSVAAQGKPSTLESKEYCLAK